MRRSLIARRPNSMARMTTRRVSSTPAKLRSSPRPLAMLPRRPTARASSSRSKTTPRGWRLFHRQPASWVLPACPTLPHPRSDTAHDPLHVLAPPGKIRFAWSARWCRAVRSAAPPSRFQGAVPTRARRCGEVVRLAAPCGADNGMELVRQGRCWRSEVIRMSKSSRTKKKLKTAKKSGIRGVVVQPASVRVSPTRVGVELPVAAVPTPGREQKATTAFGSLMRAPFAMMDAWFAAIAPKNGVRRTD